MLTILTGLNLKEIDMTGLSKYNKLANLSSKFISSTPNRLHLQQLLHNILQLLLGEGSPPEVSGESLQFNHSEQNLLEPQLGTHSSDPLGSQLDHPLRRIVDHRHLHDNLLHPAEVSIELPMSYWEVEPAGLAVVESQYLGGSF